MGAGASVGLDAATAAASIDDISAALKVFSEEDIVRIRTALGNKTSPAADASEEIEIEALAMSGESLAVVKVLKTCLVGELKQKIAEAAPDISKDMHLKQLVLNGKTLEAALSIQECSITSGMALTLVTPSWPEGLPEHFRTPTIDAGFRTEAFCIYHPESMPDCTPCTRPEFDPTVEGGMNGWSRGELKSEQASRFCGENFRGEFRGTFTSWFHCIYCGAPCSQVEVNPFGGIYKIASGPSTGQRREISINHDEIYFEPPLGPQDEALDEDSPLWINVEGLVQNVGPGKPQQILIKMEDPKHEEEDDEAEYEPEVLTKATGEWTGRGILWEDGTFWEWIEPLPIEEE